MLNLKLPLLLLFILSTSISQLSAQENTQNWQLVKDEKGIKVYTRILEHSNYKEFRGVLDIQTSLDDLLAFINNESRCPDWQYRCIKRLNLSDGYIYKLSELPWPFSDRYTVMQSKKHFDQQQNIFTLRLKNIKREQLPKKILAQLPEQNNTVQMRYSDGYWQFKLDNASSINITYQMLGDPARVFPAILADQGVINAAFITLSNLKKHFTTKPKRVIFRSSLNE